MNAARPPGLILTVIRGLGRRQKMLVFLLLDAALAPTALWCAVVIDHGRIAAPSPPWPLFLALSVSAAIVALRLGIPRIRLKSYDFTAVMRSGLHAVLLAAGGAVATRLCTLPVTPGGWVVFALCYSLLATGARLVMLQALVALYRADSLQARVLIYGAGRAGMQLAAALQRDDRMRPVAFIDDNPALQGLSIAGLTVHGPGRLPDLLWRHGVSRVLLAMPGAGRARQARVAARVRQSGAEVQVVPGFAELIATGTPVPRRCEPDPAEFLGRDPVPDALAGLQEVYGGQAVLVTGAGGSIGSELARQILSLRPSHLILLDHSEYALYLIEREIRPVADAAGVALSAVLGSVGDPALVRRVLADHAVGIVLHAAAYKHVPLVEGNPLAGLANNVLGTEVLARAAAGAGVRRFVMVSSDKAVRPTNVMGASKRLAEIVVQDLARRSCGCVFSMVRFGNVLGSSGSVLPLFQDQIARGGPVTVTGRDVTRYFMTVEEAVALVLRAGALACGGEVFLLDMGQAVPIGDLARKVITAFGCTVRDAANPDGDIEIVEIGLRPGEKRHEELLIAGDCRATSHPRIFAAQEPCPSQVQVAALLRDLREALAEQAVGRARRVIECWVEDAGSDSRLRRAGL